ncbi:hypothetical protein BCR42DRAFT_32224 [Absidia repens]|uniref:MARVEL domain-containing protein n=1 Tax=Absidia repens TaxID=90262 RepID=A0A1X2IGS2_9FUNG|nr:hypothetical protein BCR42DRAFT_32224 [Absidia repens]
MGLRVFWLVLLRTLLVLTSIGTIGCHIAQVILLGNQRWWPSNYAYILYFVGPGVSTLSSLALLFTMIFKIKSIRGDRILGCLNLALMIATVVIGAIKSGPVPWLPDNSTSSNNNSQLTASGPTSGGFQSNCGVYEKEDREIFNRCWLSNGMWIGSIVVAFFWLLLVLYVFIQRGSDIYDDDEYEVYDFKATTFTTYAIRNSPYTYGK